MLNKLILLSLFLVVFSACLNFNRGLEFQHNLPSVGEESAPSDSEYFYVDLDTNKYSGLAPYYEMSTTTEYGDAEERDSLSNCEIYYEEPEEGELGEKSASEENLVCILDLLEYEFLVKDIHLVYNLPSGMCETIRTAMPWHFNHEILPGPIVNRCTGPGGTDDDGNPTEGKEGLCEVIDGECECFTEDVEEEEFCDGSATIGETVVRCCDGGRKSDGSEWKPDIQCFGGPSLVAQTHNHVKEDFYVSYLSDPEERGLRGEITLPNLISINRRHKRSNSPNFNYLKALDLSADQLVNFSKDDLPDFLKKSPNFIYEPRLFFEFSCLDGAGEVLHKILLLIREWNTFEEFREFYNEGGNDSSDPDVEGLEGEDCAYEDRGTLDEDSLCNDLFDLDDIADCLKDPLQIQCLYFPDGYPRINYSIESAASSSGE